MSMRASFTVWPDEITLSPRTTEPPYVLRVQHEHCEVIFFGKSVEVVEALATALQAYVASEEPLISTQEDEHGQS